MDPRDKSDLPDAVGRYADHADGLIDVHLPLRSSKTRPLVVLLHGGFWRVAYDRLHTRPLANALAGEGFVVATPEYRRVGGSGDLAGGWPSTFDDISAAMEALPGLLSALGTRCDTTTVVGHSAGGHLALWLANEGHPVDRVVALAPVGDLRAAVVQNTGSGAPQELLGGSPTEVPERYDAADPGTRLRERPACEIVIVHGSDDQEVPVQNSRGLAKRFPFIDFRELEGVEHYGLIEPQSTAWPVVRDAVRGEAANRGLRRDCHG